MEPRDLFFYLFIGLLIAAGVLAVVLFILLAFKNTANKKLDLNNNANQVLDSEEASYFSFIGLDASKNRIVLQRKGNFSKAVLTLVFESGGKRNLKRYKVNFTNGDLAMISLSTPVDSYKVFVESVDGNLTNDSKTANWLTPNLIYGLVVGVLYAGSVFCFCLMDSTYIQGYWPGFALYYVLSAIGLVFPVLTIFGGWLFNFLSRKGVF